MTDFDKTETTQPLGVPEVEPRAELPPLPEDRAEAASRELRHRAHRYHGMTRVKPPASQHDLDVARSELERAAIRFAHAVGAKAKLDPLGQGCACVFCVS